MTHHWYRIIGEDDGQENEIAVLQGGMLMFYERNLERTGSATLLLGSRMPGCVAYSQSAAVAMTLVVFLMTYPISEGCDRPRLLPGYFGSYRTKIVYIRKIAYSIQARTTAETPYEQATSGGGRAASAR